MGTTKEDIKRWLKLGKEKGATHLIVVCDSFDYTDYPVYVMSHEDVHEKKAKYNGQNMQSIMEVYNLEKDIKSQLNEYRSFNY